MMNTGIKRRDILIKTACFEDFVQVIMPMDRSKRVMKESMISRMGKLGSELPSVCDIWGADGYPFRDVVERSENARSFFIREW